MLGGIIRAQVATKAKWRACVEAPEAKVIELKALLAAREAYM